MMPPRTHLSVIVPTHNPHLGRLRRTFASLQAQTFPAAQWETVLVDNASSPALVAAHWTGDSPNNLRLVREAKIGLSHARQCGLQAARGDIVVLVDDDNVLAPDYLETVLALFTAHPQVGALGGRSVPEFEIPPPAWTKEFHSLLALRDLGDTPIVSQGLRSVGAAQNEYPAFAPIGAGMALRRVAWTAWLDARRDQTHPIPDRRGSELTSGGDNDIILCAMRAGWEVGYFPALSLTHLIPPERLETNYLGRLNRGIARSWVRVLARHSIRPWPAVTQSTVWLRQARAWWRTRAWQHDAAWVRWQGLCGTFEGQADIARVDENLSELKPVSKS